MTRAGLQAVGLGHVHGRIALLGNLPPAAVAAALQVAIAERIGRPTPRIELVWTGPEPAASPARDTAVVVRQLFDEAERSVLVAGFTFDHGAAILRHLWLAMRDRGVAAKMVLQVDRAEAGAIEARVRSTADAFLRANWPFGDPVPELWYDPRTVQPGSIASMHAKCVVVDEVRALVGS
ncbi:MAG: phospholipase D-like domain-containing protein, partial [Myxococcota bacterium]